MKNKLPHQIQPACGARRPPRWPGVAALALVLPCAASAEPNPPVPGPLSEPGLEQATVRDNAQWPARDRTQTNDYLPAALQIAGFQLLLNRFDHAFVGPEYAVSAASVRRNLRSSWDVDRDPFLVNQIGHPYQGSVYFGLARSNGIGFWGSMGYAFAGSAVWEVAGETTPPSRNDQITTSFGGTFVGEALYRMANLVLEQGGLSPRWREVAAAAVSPAVGVNRRMRPGRGAGAFASHSPATFSRLMLGASAPVHNDVGSSQSQRRNEAAADYLLEYGLPGKPGYTYHRPFDYFRFQLRASSLQGVESVSTRGLLLGAPYAPGPAVRGVWGLYGSYDYLSPQLFRVASTALSLGSNAQWRLSENVVMQGHAGAGMGYTSSGTVRGLTNRQYNYGLAPQAMLSARLILGDRLDFDITGREYFNGKLARSDTGGTDRVFRGDASLTYRVYRNHAVALRYITSRRAYFFPDVAERKQRRDTFGLYYVYQAAQGLGAVRW